MPDHPAPHSNGLPDGEASIDQVGEGIGTLIPGNGITHQDRQSGYADREFYQEENNSHNGEIISCDYRVVNKHKHFDPFTLCVKFCPEASTVGTARKVDAEMD